VSVAVDDHGVVPVFVPVSDGHPNGHPSLAEPFDRRGEHLPQPARWLVSERGTLSARHLGRAHRDGVAVRGSAPGNDSGSRSDAPRTPRTGHRASYLSLEPRRRRQGASSLPPAPYERAVLRHPLTDPDRRQEIPCRVICVSRSAEAHIEQATREKAVAQRTAGREPRARAVREGRRHTEPAARALNSLHKVTSQKS
jgi:hypothetical protein